MAAWPARVVATGVATPARRLALVASTLVALAAAVVCTQPLESTVVDEIMAAATPRLDPGGVPSALRWDAPGAFNGTAGTYELVIDTSTNTVLHFLFKAG